MPDPAIELDAAFFELIHNLVRGPKQREHPERRGGQRLAFTSTQQIAPRQGKAFPDEADFLTVQCHDLTRSGFSFLMPCRPHFASLVAAFGTGSERIYVAADVLHCADVLLDASGRVTPVSSPNEPTPSKDTPGRSPQRLVLVGCRFAGRVEPPSKADRSK